jgi:hypothetical protein
LVNVTVRVAPVVNALKSCHEPPTPSKVIGQLNVVPLEVIVFAVVAVNVSAPVADHVGVTLVIDTDPAMLIVPVLENVTAPAETLKSRQFRAPVKVTVYVPAWSKNTLSAEVGTDAPLAPPGEADQFVVLLVFHVPEPPTQ